MHRLSVILTFLVFGCAGTSPQQSALRAAEISFMTYESVSDAVVDETRRLVIINRTRSLTGTERAKVVGLNALRDLLDRYSVSHNLYIMALKARDGSTIAKARAPVVDLWREVVKDALNLNLVFNAVAP